MADDEDDVKAFLQRVDARLEAIEERDRQVRERAMTVAERRRAAAQKLSRGHRDPDEVRAERVAARRVHGEDARDGDDGGGR